MFSGMPSGCPSVRPLTFISCDAMEGFQWNLPPIFNIWVRTAQKGFQGQRWKVKVMTRPNAIMAEVCILTVWRRGSLVIFVKCTARLPYTFLPDFTNLFCFCIGVFVNSHYRERLVSIRLASPPTRHRCCHLARVRSVLERWSQPKQHGAWPTHASFLQLQRVLNRRMTDNRA